MEIICSSYLPVYSQSMVHSSAINTEVSYLPQSLHCEKKSFLAAKIQIWRMIHDGIKRMKKYDVVSCCLELPILYEGCTLTSSGQMTTVRRQTAAILSPRTLFGVGSNSSSNTQVSLLWCLHKQLKYTDVLTWSNWVVFIQIMMHDDCITQPLTVLFDSSEVSVRCEDQDQMFQWLREYFHINNGSSDKPTENCMTQSSPYHSSQRLIIFQLVVLVFQSGLFWLIMSTVRLYPPWHAPLLLHSHFCIPSDGDFQTRCCHSHNRF